MSDKEKAAATDDKPKVFRHYIGEPPTIEIEDDAGNKRVVENPRAVTYAGVPAHDLTKDEYDALDERGKQLVDDGHVESVDTSKADKDGKPIIEVTHGRLFSKTKSSGRKDG